MGNIVSLKDGLIITVFSMAIVFLSLLAISYLIDGLSLVIGEKEVSKDMAKDGVLSDKKEIVSEKETRDDSELVAVIAAAIAANEGVSIPQVKIKSIKRIRGSASYWAKVGKREQVFTRL